MKKDYTPGEKLYLWSGEAPYTQECPQQKNPEELQAQPSLTAYTVPNARGAVVICPGGGYGAKAAHEGAPIAQVLNTAGISGFVLDYRVLPCPYEAPLADAKRAIRYLRACGYEKVGILGFSAGGHLCCSAATLYDAGNPEAEDPVERFSSRPDAFVPCYPVVTFNKPFCHFGSRHNLLGQWETDEEICRRFSAEENITPDTPPAFIWHTAEDYGVSTKNSLFLAAALVDQHVSYELHIYPKGNHGLGLAPSQPIASNWSGECCRWLLNLGFGA